MPDHIAEQKLFFELIWSHWREREQKEFVSREELHARNQNEP